MRGLECVVASATSARPHVIYQDADLAVVDGQNMSVLSSGNLALELAFAKARVRGLAVIKIRHCRQRQLIMGYLSRLADRGMNVTAFWRHSQSPLTEQVVGFPLDPQCRPFACMSLLTLPMKMFPMMASR